MHFPGATFSFSYASPLMAYCTLSQLAAASVQRTLQQGGSFSITEIIISLV